MKTIMPLYDNVILKYPKAVLLFLLILLGFFGYQIKDFQLDSSAESMVLEDDADLSYFRTISERYATPSFLVITYKPDAPLFSEEALGPLTSLRDELVALERIESINSILNVPLLKNPPSGITELVQNIKTLEHPQVNLTLAQKEMDESPLYDNLLLNLDKNITALQLNFPIDMEYRQLIKDRETLKKNLSEPPSPQDKAAIESITDKIYELNARNAENLHQDIVKVRSIMEKYRGSAELYLGGVPMIADDMSTFVKDDISSFGLGVLAFLIITLLIIFRRFRWMFLALATCAYVVIMVTGVLTYFDWKVTVISSNYISLLLILTMSLSIHLIVRYRELYILLPDATQHELVRTTLEKMFIPCLYTSLTTLVAFASLVYSGIRPIIDFGWMMSAGIMIAFVCAFTFLPCLLVLMRKGQEPTSVEETNQVTRFFAFLTTQHGSKILVAYSLLAVLTLVGLTRLTVENSFINYFDESTEIYQGMVVIDQNLGGTTPLDVLIDFPRTVEDTFDDSNEEDDFVDDFESDFSDSDFEDDFDSDTSVSSQDAYWFTETKVNQIKAIHDYLDSLEATGKVLSLATMTDIAADINKAPLSTFELGILYNAIPENFKALVLDPYVSVSESQARISLRIIDSNPDLKRDELLKKIKNDIVEKFGFKEDEVHLSGMMVLYNNMLQSLFESQILTLGVVFLGIMLMFLILFRSLSLAVIGIIPNLLAAGFVLSILGWSGIPLDLMTITIAAITIGIAVDNTIHYIHRFKVEFLQDQNYESSVKRCHGSIGRAVFYTSTTIIVGFSILGLSNFKPTIYFGLLTGLAMLTALIGVLTLLPRLLIVIKPLGKNIHHNNLVVENGENTAASPDN